MFCQAKRAVLSLVEVVLLLAALAILIGSITVRTTLVDANPEKLMISHGKKKRLALSLIEVVVVLGILATLMGLIVTSVFVVQEAANRAACQHKLHELAIAVHHHHNDKGHMPPYASGKGGEIFGGWFVHLLPYIGHQNMYGLILSNSESHHGGVHIVAPAIYMDGIRDAQFPNLLCPSDASMGPPTDRGKTNYLANWFAWSDGKHGPYGPAQKFSQITDGLANTVMFAEGYGHCDGLDRVALVSSHFHNFGITQDARPSDDPYYLPNDYTMFQVQPRQCDKWRSQTPHAAMHVAMFDGSVQSINAGILPDVWTRALKPQDENW